ncbi:MAG: hypothetical protein VYA84_18325 [Planctomycetota bacterium]|nr:hypothetical protein [Planctomycetota bacterium]
MLLKERQWENFSRQNTQHTSLHSSYNRLGWSPEHQASGESGAQETLHCGNRTNGLAITLGTVLVPTGTYTLFTRHDSRTKLNAGSSFLEAIEPVRKRTAGMMLARRGIGAAKMFRSTGGLGRFVRKQMGLTDPPGPHWPTWKPGRERTY